MIPALDLAIRGVLRNSGLANEQIGFQPPDDLWRNHVRTVTVGGKPAPSANVYLVDVRENQTLRSNAVHREITNGITQESDAPFRLDCHYLISAWSAAKDMDQFAATVAEHQLLSAAVLALARAAPLNPSRILPASEIAMVPLAMRDSELPTRVVPPEGFPKLAEFWGTMGDGNRWKPAAQLVATVPLIYEPAEAGGIVDTILVDLGQDLGPAAAERALVIGGVVLDATAGAAVPPVPVGGARVDLLSGVGAHRATATTQADGTFTFEGLAPGTYGLAYSHPLHPAVPPQPVTVPLASGPVRLVFS